MLGLVRHSRDPVDHVVPEDGADTELVLHREEASLDDFGQPIRLALNQRELGDLLFAVINLSRKLGVDPRAALEKANRRFSSRFKEVERLAEAGGVRFGEASLEELDVLWEEAKRTAD